MSTRCVLVGSWLVLCVLAVNIAVVRVKAGGPVAKAAVLAAVVHVLSIPDFPVVAAVAPEVGAHLRMLRCRSARRRCVIFPPPGPGTPLRRGRPSGHCRISAREDVQCVRRPLLTSVASRRCPCGVQRTPLSSLCAGEAARENESHGSTQCLSLLPPLVPVERAIWDRALNHRGLPLAR